MSFYLAFMGVCFFSFVYHTTLGRVCTVFTWHCFSDTIMVICCICHCHSGIPDLVEICKLKYMDVLWRHESYAYVLIPVCCFHNLKGDKWFELYIVSCKVLVQLQYLCDPLYYQTLALLVVTFFHHVSTLIQRWLARISRWLTRFPYLLSQTHARQEQILGWYVQSAYVFYIRTLAGSCPITDLLSWRIISYLGPICLSAMS